MPIDWSNLQPLILGDRPVRIERIEPAETGTKPCFGNCPSSRWGHPRRTPHRIQAVTIDGEAAVEARCNTCGSVTYWVAIDWAEFDRLLAEDDENGA